MNTELLCLPCFFKQVRRTLAYAGVNGEIYRRAIRMAEAVIEKSSLDTVPARISTLIHRLLRKEIGIDPYRMLKDRYNVIALERLPLFRNMMKKSTNPLETGVRLAVAGNIIDFGIYEHVDIDRSIRESQSCPLSHEVLDAFTKAVSGAKRILYLCDNAGEIVFDRPLMELLGSMGKQVTAVVKGAPVINDATMEDAAAVGLSESARVIDNGSDGIGTLLETCSRDFIDEYQRADMIISKGQANFETLLQERDGRIFFLFKVKCPVVSNAIKRPEGEMILMQGADGRGHAEASGLSMGTGSQVSSFLTSANL